MDSVVVDQDRYLTRENQPEWVDYYIVLESGMKVPVARVFAGKDYLDRKRRKTDTSP